MIMHHHFNDQTDNGDHHRIFIFVFVFLLYHRKPKVVPLRPHIFRIIISAIIITIIIAIIVIVVIIAIALVIIIIIARI